METFDGRINHIIMKYLQHRDRDTPQLSLVFYTHAVDRANYNYVYRVYFWDRKRFLRFSY